MHGDEIESEPTLTVAERAAVALDGLERQLADATAERAEVIDRQGRLAMRMHAGDAAAGEAYRGVAAERRRLDETVDGLTLAVQAARAEHGAALANDLADVAAARAERIDALLDLRQAAIADAERALRLSLDRLERAGALAEEIVGLRGPAREIRLSGVSLEPDKVKSRVSAFAQKMGLARWLHIDGRKLPFLERGIPPTLVEAENAVQDRYRLTIKEDAA